MLLALDWDLLYQLEKRKLFFNKGSQVGKSLKGSQQSTE